MAFQFVSRIGILVVMKVADMLDNNWRQRKKKKKKNTIPKECLIVCMLWHVSFRFSYWQVRNRRRWKKKSEKNTFFNFGSEIIRKKCQPGSHVEQNLNLLKTENSKELTTFRLTNAKNYWNKFPNDRPKAPNPQWTWTYLLVFFFLTEIKQFVTMSWWVCENFIRFPFVWPVHFHN